MIKIFLQVFFDLLFPLACALCLIYGAKRGSRCLLISWFCIVFVSYIQYLYVFFASDWSEADVSSVNSFVLSYLSLHTFTLVVVKFIYVQDCIKVRLIRLCCFVSPNETQRVLANVSSQMH